MEERILFALVGAVVSGAGFVLTFQVQLAILKEKVTYLSDQQKQLVAKIFPPGKQ